LCSDFQDVPILVLKVLLPWISTAFSL
jgi:hypothetical protein